MTDEQVIIRSASKNDAQQIADLLFESFYPYEPITICGKSGAPSQSKMDLTLSTLSDNMSFIAYVPSSGARNDEHLVGVILCRIARPTDAQFRLDWAEKVQTEDAEWSKLLKFWAWVDIQNDHFRRLNIDRGYHCHVLAVSENYRGRNIAKSLMTKSIENARKMNFKLFTINCSSFITIRMAQSFGMTSNNFTTYKKIVDENGQQFYNPPQPHTSFGIFELPL